MRLYSKLSPSSSQCKSCSFGQFRELRGCQHMVSAEKRANGVHRKSQRMGMDEGTCLLIQSQLFQLSNQRGGSSEDFWPKSDHYRNGARATNTMQITLKGMADNSGTHNIREISSIIKTVSFLLSAPPPMTMWRPTACPSPPPPLPPFSPPLDTILAGP